MSKPHRQNCPMCAELRKERDRILKSYRKEKKVLYYVIGSLLCVIVAMSIGIDNTIKLLEYIK